MSEPSASTAPRTPSAGQVFAFAAPVEVRAAATDDEGKPRTFSGIAYTGAVIEKYYDHGLIIDLAGGTLPTKLPMLIEHDRNQRAGWADKLKVHRTKGIEVSGQLMDTPSGRTVADENDQGFPWQFSVHVRATEVEHIERGKKARINGASHEGPMTVFRAWRLLETSFTPTGADSETEAFVFSAVGGAPEPHPPEPHPSGSPDKEADCMSTEELQAALAQSREQTEALNKALEGVRSEFDEYRASQRRSAVGAYLTEIGLADTDEHAKPYLDMPEAAFASVREHTLGVKAASAKGDGKGDAQAGAGTPPGGLPDYLKGEKATDGEAPKGDEAQLGAVLDAEVDALIKGARSGMEVAA